jgi:hypothetical protein
VLGSTDTAQTIAEANPAWRRIPSNWPIAVDVRGWFSERSSISKVVIKEVVNFHVPRHGVPT